MDAPTYRTTPLKFTAFLHRKIFNDEQMCLVKDERISEGTNKFLR